ncbi:MAG: thiamine diphosphokinase [Candidatus Cryptobacteroides sp.]
MRIAILAAGDYPRKPYPLYLLQSADVIVCCDSALETALRHSLKVSAVVGDMDSIKPSLLKRFEGEKVHESEQDYNDLTKAMRYVTSHYPEAEEIDIIGATGRHEAHTIGNLSLLMTYENWWGFWDRKVTLQIVSDYCSAFAISSSCKLNVGEGRKVSFFSEDRSLRVKSQGLEWPLDEVEFDSWWKATLNRSQTDEITLDFNHPAALLVILE